MRLVLDLSEEGAEFLLEFAQAKGMLIEEAALNLLSLGISAEKAQVFSEHPRTFLPMPDGRLLVG